MRFSFFCNRKKIQILPNDAGHWSGRLEMVWKTPRTGSLATGFTPSLVTAQQTQKNAQKNSFTGFTILYIVDSPHSKSLKSALESSFSNLRGSKWPNSTKLYIIYHLKIKKKLYEKVGNFEKNECGLSSLLGRSEAISIGLDGWKWVEGPPELVH